MTRINAIAALSTSRFALRRPRKGRRYESDLSRRRAARAKAEKGVALVETAMTLPLVLLITIGAVEFGRAYQTWQVLTNAAREGARVAVLPGVTDTAVKDRVGAYMKSGQLGAADDATVTVTRNNPLALGASTATASNVVVTYPFKFIVLQPVAQLVVSGTTLGEPLTMSASALMRNEN